ncbi:unnamed protein product [Tetraodon nigroviridis]|uniref:Chromosome undetermined SCAF14659, whole genome shotgun sequence n=1 Tax=Tetraodon nigroviridis TaxID=99883 RepID=Q4SC68_TETNG|nr:unnamed protein product [Tetraodon nigroviridis]
MQLFTPLTILLCIPVVVAMSPPRPPAPLFSAQRATTCEGRLNVHHLKCDSGVISVRGALYGRADTTTCSEGRPPRQLSNTACSHKGTMDVVSRRCNGKKECEINERDVTKRDPCRGTHKYLETNYTCLPATHLIVCENSLAHLSCYDGQVIFVYGADYGRRDTTTCAYRRPTGQTKNTLCFRSTKTVADRCNWKNSCTFKVENRLFGDPCRGTYKYLEVAYRCEYPWNIPGGP